MNTLNLPSRDVKDEMMGTQLSEMDGLDGDFCHLYRWEGRGGGERRETEILQGT